MRSPCGTPTHARLCTLAARRKTAITYCRKLQLKYWSSHIGLFIFWFVENLFIPTDLSHRFEVEFFESHEAWKVRKVI